MRALQLIWLLAFTFQFESLECAKCPKFCVCYMWRSLCRIDCVSQGLLDVDIGLDHEDGCENTKNVTGAVARSAVKPGEVLDLSHNTITSLAPGAFHYFTLIRLVALHLSHNSIAHISPSTLQGLQNLRLLDLSFNRIRRHPGVPSGSIMRQPAILPAQLFKDAHKLSALRLGSNPLENEGFQQKTGSIQDGEPLLIAPALEFLDLGSCHLAHVGRLSFVGLPSLRTLNLSDNQLISLSPSTMGNMINLQELLLKENPWPCDKSGDMAELEKWLSTKKFHPACPEKKFEKLMESGPKRLGPQKAKDDSSLLYYYHILGIAVKEEHPLTIQQHSDYPDDVEVFLEDGLKPLDKRLEKIRNVATFHPSNETQLMDQAHCSVHGIPIVWYFALSFLAGVVSSFLCSFSYFTKLCKISDCLTPLMDAMKRRNSTASRRRYFSRIKRLSSGEQFSSLSNSGRAHENGESFLLIDESEDNHQNLGLSTPVLQRAATSPRKTGTPPPTYDQHLAMHPFQTDY